MIIHAALNYCGNRALCTRSVEKYQVITHKWYRVTCEECKKLINEKNEGHKIKMENPQSLKELWHRNGGKPFTAQRNDGKVCRVIGLDETRAYGWFEKTSNEMRHFDYDAKLYETYQEPTPVAHWFAICRNHNGETISITRSLYENEEQAKKYFRDKFIKLAKELPPIMITPFRHYNDEDTDVT